MVSDGEEFENFHKGDTGLNPCFNGRWSLTRVLRFFTYATNVLILVLKMGLLSVLTSQKLAIQNTLAERWPARR